MMRQELPSQPVPLVDRVKRWDVYDIADELADVPGMLTAMARSAGPEDFATKFADVHDAVSQLERRLWAASERGGSVGPAPEYASAVALDDEEARRVARGIVYGLLASVLAWPVMIGIVVWLVCR